MTDIAGLTSDDDVTFARRLIARPGRGGGAGLVVLLAAGARPDEAPVRVPEAARDAAGGVGAAGEAGRDRDAGLSGAPGQALSAALATIPVSTATPTLASVPSR